MWMRALAIAVPAFLLAPFAYGVSPLMGSLLVLVAVAGCGWAMASGLAPRFKTRDPYDLGELRRLQEEEELRAAEPEGALPMGDHVVCPRCFQEFSSRLRACPRCGAGA